MRDFAINKTIIVTASIVAVTILYFFLPLGGSGLVGAMLWPATPHLPASPAERQFEAISSILMKHNLHESICPAESFPFAASAQSQGRIQETIWEGKLLLGPPFYLVVICKSENFVLLQINWANLSPFNICRLQRLRNSIQKDLDALRLKNQRKENAQRASSPKPMPAALLAFRLSCRLECQRQSGLGTVGPPFFELPFRKAWKTCNREELQGKLRSGSGTHSPHNSKFQNGNSRKNTQKSQRKQVIACSKKGVLIFHVNARTASLSYSDY